MTVGQKVASLAEHWKLSQEDLAKVLGGVTRSTIASYKNDPSKNPSQDRTREWAREFGIPFEWFIDGAYTPPPVSVDYEVARENGRQIEEARATYAARDAAFGLRAVHPDVLTYEEDDFALGADMVDIPAWQGVMANLDETHFIQERRPRTLKVPPFFFSRKKLDRFIVGLPQGHSMAPRIVAPDRVIVLLASDAQPNSIVVARRSDGVNFVKVLRIDRMGKKELHSINPDFPPITDLVGWVMKGVVVGIWKPYIDDGTNIEFNGGMPLRA